MIFEAVKRAKAEGIQVVIADTAGRLHTKTDLMEELQKVRRVLGRAQEGAPHETWLVIDATSGQNAIAQAQIFTEAMAVSGIVLTKLDGTAKGGVILGIADQLRIPVRYIGVGERVEDLREFDPEEFVEALFEGQNPSPEPSGPDRAPAKPAPDARSSGATRGDCAAGGSRATARVDGFFVDLKRNRMLHSPHLPAAFQAPEITKEFWRASRRRNAPIARRDTHQATRYSCRHDRLLAGLVVGHAGYVGEHQLRPGSGIPAPPARLRRSPSPLPPHARSFRAGRAGRGATDLEAGVTRQTAPATPGAAAQRSWQDVVVVPRKAFLKDGRLELFPSTGVSLNDVLIRHYSFGGNLNYYLTDVFSIGLEGQYYIKERTDRESIVGLQYNRIATLNRYLYSGSLNFGYVPGYGKFTLFNRYIIHWDLWVQGGVGLIQTEIIPRVVGDTTFKNNRIAPSLGLGTHLFLSNWLTFNVAVKDYVFNDLFEPTDRHAERGHRGGQVAGPGAVRAQHHALRRAGAVSAHLVHLPHAPLREDPNMSKWIPDEPLVLLSVLAASPLAGGIGPGAAARTQEPPGRRSRRSPPPGAAPAALRDRPRRRHHRSGRTTITRSWWAEKSTSSSPTGWRSAGTPPTT